MTSSELQARAQLATVVALEEALRVAIYADDYPGWDAAIDAATRAITDNALSFECRSGWSATAHKLEAAEYQILLRTDEPAVRITGQLFLDGTPATAEFQYQDWGTPWMRLSDTSFKDERAVMIYARQFYIKK